MNATYLNPMKFCEECKHNMRFHMNIPTGSAKFGIFGPYCPTPGGNVWWLKHIFGGYDTAYYSAGTETAKTSITSLAGVALLGFALTIAVYMIIKKVKKSNGLNFGASFTCKDCGTAVSRGIDGYCNDCYFEYHGFVCQKCGMIKDNEEMADTGNDDDEICADCARGAQSFSAGQKPSCNHVQEARTALTMTKASIKKLKRTTPGSAGEDYYRKTAEESLENADDNLAKAEYGLCDQYVQGYTEDWTKYEAPLPTVDELLDKPRILHSRQEYEDIVNILASKLDYVEDVDEEIAKQIPCMVFIASTYADGPGAAIHVIPNEMIKQHGGMK